MGAGEDDMQQTTDSARERLLTAAHRLFYEHGIRATGIDRIIAESGVAKMSFYRHFPSKDDLALCFLSERHARWMDWFKQRCDALGTGRKQRLPAAADALREWFSEPGFRGCAFINTLAELGPAGEDSPALAIVQAHKDELLAYLESLIDAPPKRRQKLARRALLVIEGAIVRAQMTRDASVAGEARDVLEMLCGN
jgi:AcrR family transcriptional regulator